MNEARGRVSEGFPRKDRPLRRDTRENILVRRVIIFRILNAVIDVVAGFISLNNREHHGAAALSSPFQTRFPSKVRGRRSNPAEIRGFHSEMMTHA